MNRTIAGGVLVLAGAVLLLVSALANPLGIGDEDEFGYKQTIGVVVGGVVIVAGLALAYLDRRGEAPPVEE
jgi:hypothetical protein